MMPVTAIDSYLEIFKITMGTPHSRVARATSQNPEPPKRKQGRPACAWLAPTLCTRECRIIGATRRCMECEMRPITSRDGLESLLPVSLRMLWDQG